MAAIEDALLALAFLTRIPLPTSVLSRGDRNFSRTFPYFPLVGILLGALCAGGALILSKIFPPEIASITVVAFLAWITRGLHLDGLADWADALGGGYNREKRLEILKDSRVGSFGVIALSLLLAAKTMSLLVLIDRHSWFPIFFAPLFGRTAMVAVAIGMQPARNTKGLGSLFLSGFSKKQFVFSLLWWIPVAIYDMPLVALTACAASAVVLILRRNFVKCFGGLTGDLFGATCELVELTALITGTISLPLW